MNTRPNTVSTGRSRGEGAVDIDASEGVAGGGGDQLSGGKVLVGREVAR
jgi:hypothetical protein